MTRRRALAASLSLLASGCDLVAGLGDYQLEPVPETIVAIAIGDDLEEQDEPRLAIRGDAIALVGSFGGAIALPNGGALTAGPGDENLFRLVYGADGALRSSDSYDGEQYGPVVDFGQQGELLIGTSIASAINLGGEDLVPSDEGEADVAFGVYDEVGNHTASSVAGGSAGTERITDVVAVGESEVLVAGTFTDRLNFGLVEGMMMADGELASFVVKLDYADDLGPAWQFELDADAGSSVVVNDLDTDSKGNVYLGGSVSGAGTIGGLTFDTRIETEAGQLQGTLGLVLRLDPDGAPAGGALLGPLAPGVVPGSVVVRAVAIGPGDSLYLAGDFRGALQLDGMNAGEQDFDLGPTPGGGDVFVTKFDLGDGEEEPSVEWAKTFIENSDGSDALRAMNVDEAGNVVLAGDFQGQLTVDGMTVVAEGPTDPSVIGAGDLFVTVLQGGNGAMLSLQRFGGPAPELMYGVDVVRDGPHRNSIVIAATYEGPIDLGTGALDPGTAGSHDVLLAILLRDQP